MSMTEASGLTGDPARIDHAADAIRGMTKDMVAELPARPYFTTYEQCKWTASGIGGCCRNERTLWWSDGATPSPSSTRHPPRALHRTIR